MSPENSIPDDVLEAGAPVSPERRRELDHLFSVTYEELRRLASTVRRGDPSATLSPTALVNEAWLKMAHSPNVNASSRIHFKRIAARAMRQLLVEAARRRHANKRGGEQGLVFVTLQDFIDQSRPYEDQVMALDTALDDLARLNPRQAAIIESRFFGGLDVAETAEVLNISEATILRDWRVAKAWLARELRRGA